LSFFFDSLDLFVKHFVTSSFLVFQTGQSAADATDNSGQREWGPTLGCKDVPDLRFLSLGLAMDSLL